MPCLVFKAVGFNALIHEGTGCTDRVAYDYKSTASKLLGGNNTDRRGAYVYIQRTSALCVCVCVLVFLALNMGTNTGTTCMQKHVLLHVSLLLTAALKSQEICCFHSGRGLSFVLL